ncbi:MAG: thioredoxin domain-containing protein [Planctomycetes bacterium]|nr:thioredoxin domain-containing protein [Planctomycetota bacterium]
MSARRRAELPGAYTGLAAVALIIVSVVAWRFAPTWVGFVASAVALAWTWRSGSRMKGDSRWAEHIATIGILVSALLLLAKHEPAWWPCDLSCNGGGGYERLPVIGLMVTKVALGAWLLLYALVAIAGLRRQPGVPAKGPHEAPSPGHVQALAWAMIGGSLFYLWTSFRLGLVCHQCLAMHTVVLALAGPMRRGALRPFVRIAAVAAGFLALLAVYGPALRTDVAKPSADPTVLTPGREDAAYVEGADANRRIGRADAAFVLELALEFQCPHCQLAYTEIEPAVRPQIDSGVLAIVIRPVIRPSQAASADLVRWSFAAAATSDRTFRHYLDGMLGTRTDLTSAQILSGPAAEGARLERLSAEAAAHAHAIDVLIERDRARLHALGSTGPTPSAVLIDRGGAVRGRWSGHLDREQIIAALASAAPAP